MQGWAEAVRSGGSGHRQDRHQLQPEWAGTTLQQLQHAGRTASLQGHLAVLLLRLHEPAGTGALGNATVRLKLAAPGLGLS